MPRTRAKCSWAVQVTKTTNMSEATLQKVDSEIRRILDEQYTVARTLMLKTTSDKVHAMTKALLEWETIDRDQLDDIMAGKEPRPPKDWTPRNAVGRRWWRPHWGYPCGQYRPWRPRRPDAFLKL